MDVVILYVVSLGLFFLASLAVPFLILGILKTIIKDPDTVLKILPFVQLAVAILLLYLTQYIWSLLGYKIGWFPAIVAVQNFIASRQPLANPGSKIAAIMIAIGSILFLNLNSLS